MEKKLKLVNKLYPWFSGLSGDLIFYIAINTIWLTTIKGFSPTEITFLSTIASLFGILFQLPALAIIKKLGNTKAIRVGSLLLLSSSIMLTFCKNYVSFAIANIFLEMSLVFEMMSAILIKNNLEYQNKNEDYVKIRNKASLIYAISTAIITLFIGILFNIHSYLPMILGIITCVFCFVISFFIFDVEEKVENNKEIKIEKVKFVFPKPFKLFLLLLIFYALAYGIIVIGQQNGKLFIQYELAKNLAITKVTTYLGIILFISRMVRVVTNYFFPIMYKKLNNKISLVFTLSLVLSCILLLLGFYLNVNFYIKLVIMTLGFSIFPSLREPVKIYSQNLLLNTYDKNYHKDMLIYFSFARHIGKFLFSLFASYILLKLPIQYLFIAFLISTIPLIYLTTKIINITKTKTHT